MMVRLNVEQQSPEWHELRKRSIGASDAPCIMGVGFKTILELWELKCGMAEPEATNERMQRGLDLEPEARQLFMDVLGIKVKPAVYQSEVVDYMIASVDGATDDDRFIVEIKCPGEKDHKLACEGKVPTKYYPQLQHQYFVTGAEKVFYFSYRPQDPDVYSVIEVKRDDDYIKKLLEAEKTFREACINLTAPPLMFADYDNKDDAQWRSLSYQYRDLILKKKILAAEEERLKEAIEDLCEGANSIGAGMKVTYGLRKGNIHYGLVPELKGLDLEPYRGKPVKTLNITFVD